jgi:acyl carrier protein
MNQTETLFAEVKHILADLLAVDEDEVVANARFESDLGGESIDLLDLKFRCKTRFGVDIAFETLIDPQQLETDETGRLAPAALQTLRERCPVLDFERISHDGNKIVNAKDLITPQVIVFLVERGLEGTQS